MERRRRGAVVALVVFAVLTVAGIVVTAVATLDPAAFGWAAFAPQQDLVLFPPGVMLVTPSIVAGVCTAIVGLVGCSGVLGYLIGRTSTPARSRPDAASDSL